MKKLLVIVLIVLSVPLVFYAQEISSLFQAKSFSEAYYNSAYQELKLRKENGQQLTEKEQQWLTLYESYLNSYLQLLNKNQRSVFTQQRNLRMTMSDSVKQVSAQYQVQKNNLSEVEKTKNTELLLGHILYSGVSGLVYGFQANYIFDINNSTTETGVPLLISGGSMLLPIFSNQYKDINSNSLWLRAHGKLIGGLYGYFATAAIFGDKINETYNDNATTNTDRYDRQMRPLAIATSLVSSVALGQIGFHLGKTKNWTDGRVATYQYYGYALPLLSTLTYYSLTENDNIRNIGLFAVGSVPLGYVAAHKLSNAFAYTRGDMTAIINNTALGALMGLSFAEYFDYESAKLLLWPIGGAVLGSAVGHYTYHSFHITRPEGRRLNYAAVGGSLIGLGTTFLIDPDQVGTYFLMMSVFGSAGYGILLNYYYKQPRFTWNENNPSTANLHFQLHPESLLLNKSLPKDMQAPLFSLKATF